MLNPLFPSNNDQDDQKAKRESGRDNTRAAHRRTNRVEPLHDLKTPKVSEANPAADLIRQKIDALYEDEPNARKEVAEAKHEPDPFSKHQEFMLNLSKSGKSLAQIQTEWHNYYIALPDEEKHEVWREFYEHNGKQSHYQTYVDKQHKQAAKLANAEGQKSELKPTHNSFSEQAVNPNDSSVVVSEHALQYEDMPQRHRTRSDIRRQIVGRVNAGGKLKARHHLQSLLFGLGVGTIVIVVTLFSFFNEYIITPFIQPSRTASATPIITADGNCAPTNTPEVIIPKINVEIPLNFSINTTNEDQIENGLEDGVVHYPTTVLPGQKGNTAFFGHSSNNIFNPGHYKFAFALLHDLVPGDTFYLTYSGTCYAYQVFQRQIVDPSDVSVLDNVPNYAATATLITCDPPGTSLHRLVVWGTQISPDPSGNTAGTNTSAALTNSAQLPSNGPSLWSRMIHGLFGWL